MAFEIIECVNPPKAGVPKVPPMGVQVSARKLGSRSGKDVRYIRVQIGAKLAKQVSLASDKQKVILLFGKAEDAGKIRVAVPANGGNFTASRDKAGNYAVTLNAATADGLFALDFPTFAIEKCEALRPTNGQSPHFVFKASGAMLAAAD
ncbi:hypothetical protein [Novosphingobium kaempferiae]|uniref:hypothetical protein n=1 Tax=Novosphingobium kaempferiae TaxID=2896849 RepID=UPI001E2D0532|nr:hypothetical protein [Novosphingobium kaempferiae]